MKHYRAVGILCLLIAGQAMAVCLVPQPRLVCAEYFASQVVARATLVKINAIGDQADPVGIAAHVYTLRADHVIRGRVAAWLQVYEGNDSGRATFDWTVGKQYLLFLFPSANRNSWELDGCGNSGPLGGAKAALDQIRAIRHAHDGGVILGVVSEQALSVPIGGVQVEAQGAGGNYSATTNAKGEFKIIIPAGAYTIRASKADERFDKADLSYADPHRVQIEPGGCVQVQFAAKDGHEARP